MKMNEQALKLFLENYNNKGMCENLEAYIKTIEKEYKKYGTKKIIKYYPWAVIERIFHMQGGTIDVVDWKYSIDFESEAYNAETGELVKETKKSLFIHLKGTWQGMTLDEFYPIFDSSTSKIIRTPDAQELNASRQRGMVRLIARLSGIGLSIFEQADTQFDDEAEDVINVKVKEDNFEKPKKVEPKAKETPKVVKEEPKVVNKREEKENAFNDILGVEIEQEEEDTKSLVDMFLGNIVEDKKEIKETKLEQPKIQEPKEDFANDSEEYSDLLLKIKSYVRTNREEIIAFRNEKNKELLTQLTYSELKELLNRIEKK